MRESSTGSQASKGSRDVGVWTEITVLRNPRELIENNYPGTKIQSGNMNDGHAEKKADASN